MAPKTSSNTNLKKCCMAERQSAWLSQGLKVRLPRRAKASPQKDKRLLSVRYPRRSERRCFANCPKDKSGRHVANIRH
jgi:hypothetical protein